MTPAPTMTMPASMERPTFNSLLQGLPVLGRAGALSRAYREARHGKQGAELVSLTAVAAITLWQSVLGDWA